MKEVEPDLSLGGDQILIRHRRMLEAIDAGVDRLGCPRGAQVADRWQAMFFARAMIVRVSSGGICA